MRNDFGAARLVIAILEMLGWITVVIGGLVAISALSGAAIGMGAFGVGGGLLEGFIIAVSGILQIASALVVKAGVVTAENSSAIRALAERHFGTSFAPSGPRHVEPVVQAFRPLGPIKTYKGRVILRAPKGVKVEGDDQVFKNVIEAERFIDGR